MKNRASWAPTGSHPLQHLTGPPAEECQAVVFDTQAGTVCVGHAQHTGSHPMHMMINKVIHLACTRTHAVIVERGQQLLFVHRQALSGVRSRIGIEVIEQCDARAEFDQLARQVTANKTQNRLWSTPSGQSRQFPGSSGLLFEEMFQLLFLCRVVFCQPCHAIDRHHQGTR